MDINTGYLTAILSTAQTAYLFKHSGGRNASTEHGKVLTVTGDKGSENIQILLCSISYPSISLNYTRAPQSQSKSWSPG
jgi:hypothetical protein